MKRFLIIALAAASAALFAQANTTAPTIPNVESVQRIDTKYAALLQWGATINARCESWNTHCEGRTEAICAEVRDQINSEIEKFLFAADAYKSPPDDPECRERVREHAIRHFADTFRCSLKYAGQSLTDQQKLEVTEAKAQLDADERAVYAEMEACREGKL